jgi:hypothetical protein
MSQVDDQGRRTNEINDIPTARANGCMVDDGNEPATENSPVADASDETMGAFRQLLQKNGGWAKPQSESRSAQRAGESVDTACV